MSSDKTALGDRMKRYEAATRYVLPPRTHTIIRVDGTSFHTYLRHVQKPFDMQFVEDMGLVAESMCLRIPGVVFAYVQSDEISLLLEDFSRLDTTPWFGGVVQKMASNAASRATMVLNQLRPTTGEGPMFDARVYTIPDPVEIANYFVWRQRDAVKNSISMAAHSYFTQAELNGVDGNARQDMLFTQRGVNWNDYPVSCKRGRVCAREEYSEDVTYEDGRTGEVVTVSALRSRWSIEDAPHFTADPADWLAQTIAVDRES